MKNRKPKKPSRTDTWSLPPQIVIEKPDGEWTQGGIVIVKNGFFCKKTENPLGSKVPGKRFFSVRNAGIIKRKIPRKGSIYSKLHYEKRHDLVCAFSTDYSKGIASEIVSGIGRAAKEGQEEVDRKFREDLQRQVEAISKQFETMLPKPHHD